MIIGRISGIRPTGYPVPVTGYPAGYRIAKKARYPAGYPAGRISGATLLYSYLFIDIICLSSDLVEGDLLLCLLDLVPGLLDVLAGLEQHLLSNPDSCTFIISNLIFIEIHMYIYHLCIDIEYLYENGNLNLFSIFQSIQCVRKLRC